jgi:Fic family protein
MPAPDDVEDVVLRRARAEYLEMPGLRLTRAQAQRLWGVDARTCEQLLSALTETRFLARTKDGAFVLSASRI